MFIANVDLPVSTQYRSEKDGKNIGIIVENKLVNVLEINLDYQLTRSIDYFMNVAKIQR